MHFYLFSSTPTCSQLKVESGALVDDGAGALVGCGAGARLASKVLG